jgi:hypothetical protein
MAQDLTLRHSAGFDPSPSPRHGQGAGPPIFCGFGGAAVASPHYQPQSIAKIVGENDPKTNVVVPVVRIVPVTGRAADIVGFIVVSAAAQDTVTSAWPHNHDAKHRKLLFLGRLFLPAAQQTPDFRNHQRGVLVLPLVEPSPLYRQPQIKADSIQVVICLAQQTSSLFTPAVISRCDRLVKIQGGVLKPLSYAKPLTSRKALQPGNKPTDKIKGTGKDNHLRHHY